MPSSPRPDRRTNSKSEKEDSQGVRSLEPGGLNETKNRRTKKPPKTGLPIRQPLLTRLTLSVKLAAALQSHISPH